MFFSLVSSIRDSSSDSEASESSIEEVEGITPSNQMYLDQDIPVTNQKDKNVSPEDRHKWRMPELPPVPKGSSGDLPVSVKELVYGCQTERVGTSPKSLDRHKELLSSSKEAHRSIKDRRTSEGLDTNVLQRTSATDKSLVEKPNAKQAQASPKDQSEGQAKGKAQVEQALPTELQNPKARKDSHGQCVHMARTLMEFKNKEEERLNQSFPKK
ncbi:hypothetical protein O181_130095 [Austropuccinia psidii MF-1]|uniref:Uncharacterized protein n=1 Tax=Austropuccinia psidii MF-1 TaxID=1389203 RepID=A0A9Q3L357_9BASI|nr:hypothetical protein [Austropuccinia psidii MF-1]